MITSKRGNILEETADALVNTVNCVGIMGKGIALQFKQAWPENYEFYRGACERHELVPGKMLVWETGMLAPRFIINFPTKNHWKEKSRLEYITDGLISLRAAIRDYKIKSIAVPPLGCGNGGLEWRVVREKIIEELSSINELEVVLFELNIEPPAAQRIVNTTVKMTPAKAILIQLMSFYNVLGYQLSQLEIQKLAYFFQEAGYDLKLRFVKGKYGPYAENLNHVLSAMEGHYTLGFTGSREKEIQIDLVEGAKEKSDGFLTEKSDMVILSQLERVRKLIDRYETPFGMELLATVYWVVKELPGGAQPNDIVQAIHAWNPRKKELFQEKYVLRALEHLKSENWI